MIPDEEIVFTDEEYATELQRWIQFRQNFIVQGNVSYIILSDRDDGGELHHFLH